jgi:hypothetical protein
LTRDVLQRFGCQRRGALDIKHHPWFKGTLVVCLLCICIWMI